MKFSKSGVLRFSTGYVPSTGAGGRIAPATYAEDLAHGHKAGPAVTMDTPVRTVNSEEGVVMTGSRGASAVIDSGASQTTRAESALWDKFAEEFSLPGIVLKLGDEEIVTTAVNKAIDKAKLDASFDREALVEDFKTRIALGTNEHPLSSWTFPHRHVDGIVRIASSTPEGNKEVWRNKGELYNKIIAASPQKLKTLLTLSPNSLLYGFWLSSDAPLLHKVPRAYAYDIVGYDVSQVQYGATKISNVPTDASKTYVRNKDGVLEEGAKGAKASELLLGSVPSFSSAHITAENIVGSGALTLGALWASCNKDTHGEVSEEQKEAAFNALAHLGVLGNMLSLEQWDIRSGCTLIPETTVWESIDPSGRTKLEVPTVDEMAADTKAAVSRAQELGIFGTAEDREEVYFSRSLAAVSASAFIKSIRNK